MAAICFCGTPPVGAAKLRFYAESGTPNRLMAASIHVSGTGGPGGAGGLEIGVPQKLFEFRSLLRASPTNLFSYAVAADGRFLVGVAADNSPPTIELISNWQKLAAAARTQ